MTEDKPWVLNRHDADHGRGWTVRPARTGDTAAIHELVHALARYEREPEAVEATEEDLAVALFGADPRVHCLVAETLADGLGERPVEGPAECPTAGEVGGEVVGMALWFVSYSTWRGRHGVWLEDLFVREDRRGLGIGAALLARLAAICLDRGYARLEWSVLDWNTPAVGFYRALGADPLDEWTTHRLSGASLARLAERG